MIVNTEVPNIERSENFKETKFGIRSQSDLVHIFSVLRNKMYSDKILAVLREYSTNAFDAHVLAGKRDLPIQVDLPTALAPTLHIRDYGPGLSEEEIREVYCMYGASTKRQSNDFNGQLGFGSKAAFSYTDSYTITSFQNGTKTVYEAFIDESNLGAVSKLVESPTTESDGIKISVPVKKSDISNFESKAKDLYQHFEVFPEFPGRPNFIEKSTYEFSGNGWRILKSHSHYSYGKDSVCVMGNVAYPLNVSLATDGSLTYEENNLYSKNVVLMFDIGELSIAASREALEYDALTKSSIRKKLNQIKSEVQASIEKSFKDVTSILEFKRKFRENRGTISAFGVKLKFKDIVIEDDHISLPNGDTKNGGAVYSKRLVERSSTNLGIRISTKTVSNYVTIDATFVDCDVLDKVDKRLASLFEKQKCGKVYMFTFATAADRDAFLKHTGLSDTELVKLSAFAPKELPKGTSKNAIAINSLLYKFLPGGRDGVNKFVNTKSIYWDALEDLPKEPLFIALDRFYAMRSPNISSEPNLIQPYDLNRMIKSFEKNTGTSISDRVVGIKIKPFKEMSKRPAYLIQFMIEELGKKLDTLKPTLTNEDIIDAIRMATEHRELHELLLLKVNVKNKLDEDLLENVSKAYADSKSASNVNNQIREIEKLLYDLGADIENLKNTTTKRKQELQIQVGDFFNRHPLLKYVDLGYHPKETATKLSEEIKIYLNR